MTLLIFDCDGVLVDSEPLAQAAIVELMGALGKPMTRAQAYEIFGGRRLADVHKAAEQWLGRPMPPGAGEEAGRKLLDRFRRELKPVDGVVAAIAALPYPRCVASSSTRERIAVSLEAAGLAPLFGDRTFSADQVAQGKPAPDLFLLAARTCGAETSQCLVIEDSALGIAAARAAGMRSVGFAGAGHADAALADRLRAAGADRVIARMADLPETIASLDTSSKLHEA